MNTIPNGKAIPNSTKSSSEVAGGKFNPANVFSHSDFPSVLNEHGFGPKQYWRIWLLSA